MKIDQTIYEPMLRQAERQLVTLDEEKIRLLRVIAGAQRELKLLATQRIQCVQAVGSIKVMLRLPLSTEEAEVCAIPGEKDFQIPEDVFKDMTLPDAAKKLLTMLNRPATHREMVVGLKKGGINQELKHLDNSLRSAMVRRPDLFVFVKEDGSFGVWQLMEWIDGTTEAVAPAVSQEPLRLVASAGNSAAAQQG
jgi:hypothetical protein